MTGESKSQILKQVLTSAIQEALSEAGEEVLLNKWVFVGDLILDGERTLMPVWDESMDAIDIESVLTPAARLAQNYTDMFTVGIGSDTLDMLGTDEEDEEDEEDDY